MARPRKIPLPVTLAEREGVLSRKIAAAEAELAAAKQKLAELRKELAGVRREQEEASLRELRDVIASSGKTAGEWLEQLRGRSA
jgi:thiamine biosynthesis protein ThiC